MLLCVVEVPAVVVGVVGMGHVPGIEKNWEKQLNINEIMRYVCLVISYYILRKRNLMSIQCVDTSSPTLFSIFSSVLLLPLVLAGCCVWS